MITCIYKKIFVALLSLMVVQSLNAQSIVPQQTRDSAAIKLKEKAKKKWTIFGSFLGLPGKVSGLMDVDLYDGSANRLSMALSQTTFTNFINFGAGLGADYAMNDYLSIALDLRLGLATDKNSYPAIFSNIMMGVRARMEVIPDKLELGISAKVGMSTYAMKLGVINPNGTITSISLNGITIPSTDKTTTISVETNGVAFALQGTADIRWHFSNVGVFLFGEIGYLHAFIPRGVSSFPLEIKNGNTLITTLNADSYNLLKQSGLPTDKASQNGLGNIAIEMSGMIFHVGLGYSF